MKRENTYINSINIDTFVDGFIDAGFFATENLEKFRKDEVIIDKKSLNRIYQSCADFIIACGDLIEKAAYHVPDDSYLGFDFWLTRNRHGSGFWDGDYPEAIGELLTEKAHTFKECYFLSAQKKKRVYYTEI